MSRNPSLSVLLLVCALVLNACGKTNSAAENIIANNPPSQGSGAQDPSPEKESELIRVTTKTDINLRTLNSGILEFTAILPANSQVEIPANSQPVNYQYRKEDGTLAFSSTGFYPSVKISDSSLSSTEIDRLNKLATGLYITATISGNIGTGPTYPALTPAEAGSGYNKFFTSSGKPKKSYTAAIAKRFPNTLNKAIKLSELPTSEQNKWSKIMTELQKVAIRTVATEKKLLIIETSQAIQDSIDFEEKGSVQKYGAWSIAVEGTATRHGFANVPCAEFMSEVLRQAYQRAGYSHFEDFNLNKENVLSYEGGSALVTNFSAYLEEAGWIPWDPQTYIPPTGAFMMHSNGVSPGHTYIVAGDNGRFIVDNGMPQGRDLRSTSQNTIDLMYQHGVFFLPPGFIPQKW